MTDDPMTQYQRRDDPTLTSKVTETNKILKTFTGNRTWGFIDNSKIGTSILNKSCLHLNESGSSALAKNIMHHIHNSNWLSEVGNLVTSNEQNCGTRLFTCPKVRGFKLANLNIASLVRHIDELRAFLIDQCFDLIALYETRIDTTISDNLVNIDGYSILRKDRNRNGGGVCLDLQSSLNYRIREDLNLNEFEVLSVDIMKPNSKAFNVTAIYRPPNCTEGFFENLENIVRTLDMESKEHILLGDLICNYLAENNDSQLMQLKQLSIIYQLEQLISQPTRITQTSSTLIDVILTNEPSRILSSGVLHIGISPKIFHSSKNTHKYVITRSFKNFNADAFRNDMRAVSWNSIDNCNTTDEMIENWYNMFTAVANNHAPIRSRRVRNKRSPWLTAELRQLITNRDQLKKQAIISNDSELWNKFKKERNKTNNEIKKAKAHYYRSQVEFGES